MAYRLSKRERGSGPWIASLAIHALVGALLIGALARSEGLYLALLRDTPDRPVAERVTYVSPRAAAGTPKATRGASAPTRIQAPAIVPDVVPPVAPSAAAPVEPSASSGVATGAGADTGRALRTLTPSYSGQPSLASGTETPRPAGAAPQALADELNAQVGAAIAARNDSLAQFPQRDPHDWTITRNGKKFGMDEHNIYLGAFTIPTAILAFLPASAQRNIGGNAVNGADRRRDEGIDAELRSRGPVQADFKSEVQRINERIARDRADHGQDPGALAKNGSGPG